MNFDIGWIIVAVAFLIALWVAVKLPGWRATPKEERPSARMDELLELRSLLRTPELQRPYVYCCTGCGEHFQALETHDFAGCRARSVARSRDEEDGGAA